MDLRIENIIYNLISIVPDKENLKVVIGNTLEEVGTLNKFSNIITYQLTSFIKVFLIEILDMIEDKVGSDSVAFARLPGNFADLMATVI